MGHNAMFYDDQGGDRVYDADSFESVFQAFFNTGVSRNGGGLAVTPAGGMRVSVAPGLANMNGKIGLFQEAAEFAIGTADASATRYDLIVVRRDDSARDITLALKAGTPGGGEPKAVTDGVLEIPLALITVAPGTSAITAAQITDRRTLITQAVPQETLDAYGVQFTAWFDALQVMLDEDVAARLGGAISSLQQGMTSHRSEYTALVSRVSSLESGQESASSLHMRKIKEWTWASGDVCAPQLLIPNYAGHEDLTALGVNADGRTNDMLMVLVRLGASAANAEVVPVFLRAGDVAKCHVYANGKNYTREFRWLTADFVRTYRKQTIYKVKNVQMQKTFNAGLYCGWTQTGSKAASSGNYYDSFRIGDVSSLTSATRVTKQNGANAAQNAKHNIYLLPVAVYAITGVESGV